MRGRQAVPLQRVGYGRIGDMNWGLSQIEVRLYPPIQDEKLTRRCFAGGERSGNEGKWANGLQSPHLVLWEISIPI